MTILDKPDLILFHHCDQIFHKFEVVTIFEQDNLQSIWSSLYTRYLTESDYLCSDGRTSKNKFHIQHFEFEFGKIVIAYLSDLKK